MARKKLLPLPREIPTTPQRSRIMSAIRGKGNKSTELRLISVMRTYGISGWRRNQLLPGRPDFAFPSSQLAIFVDGCFWHGCPKCYKEPKQNVAFWREKIRRNVARDKRNSRQLRKLGWSVLRIREHSLNDGERIAHRIGRALQKLI